MLRAVRFVCGVLWLLMLPAWPLFWLMCRMQAEQCPRCASRWRTTLVGEWDGEQWGCDACGHWWETPYKR